MFNLQWIAFTFDSPGAESGGNPYNGIYREAPTERRQPHSQGLFPGLGKVPGNEVGKGYLFQGDPSFSYFKRPLIEIFRTDAPDSYHK